jgi:hypothetical protein
MEMVKEIWGVVCDRFVKLGMIIATFFVNLWNKIAGFCVRFAKGVKRFFVNFGPSVVRFCVWFGKGTVSFTKETFYTFKNYKSLTAKQKEAYWDKVTTGILVLVFCLPVAILAYILLWFVLK